MKPFFEVPIVHILINQYPYSKKMSQNVLFLLSIKKDSKGLYLPVCAFNAVSKKTYQVLVTHMTNSINLYSKLFLSLSPTKSKISEYLTKLNRENSFFF